MSALAERGDFAFSDPILITRDRIVIDGYARWELAKRLGRRVLDCFEHQFNLEEALERLIRTHHSSPGLADFVRIELALDLEVHFQERALMNQQAGGKGKGLSKLTKAQRVDARREVAQVAGVSSGNVRKVKNILAHACPTLLQACRTKEVSINLADKWSHEPHVQQQEYLRIFRIEGGIKRKARNLVAAEVASMQDRKVIKLPDLVRSLNELLTGSLEQSNRFASIEFGVVHAPGRKILVAEELIVSLAPHREVIAG